jgi:predicted enzyme related to lactoylglutathione lyase
MTTGLFENLDCLGVQVPDIDVALEFYQGKLGQRLLWRTPTSAGLAFAQAGEMPELVLHTDPWPIAAAIKVRSVKDAIEHFVRAGGTIVERPSEIAIGLLAVVADPWGNHLVLLDATKGRLKTDAEQNVVGVWPAA